MADRADDKYDKIKRQENKFRFRFTLLAVFLLAFLGVHFYFHDDQDREYLHKVKNNGAKAADKSSNHGGGAGGLKRTLATDTSRKDYTTEGKTPVADAKEGHKVMKIEEVSHADNTGSKEQKQDNDGDMDEETLVKEVERIDFEVRQIKAKLPPGKFMETDTEGVNASKRLQDATRKLLRKRYGPNEPYRVRVELEFQPTIPDFEKDGGKDGMILIEMAPSTFQPHSIFTFMEVARKYKGGGFHRIAGHVLQVMVKNTGVEHLAFQEYSPEWPHKKGTVGYAGRPSGPAWYVSLINNVRNHGPGSQQKANPHEADSCFGKVIEGFDTDVQRIRKVPGQGFLNDRGMWVLIKKMQIMVPESDGKYVDWAPSQ